MIALPAGVRLSAAAQTTLQSLDGVRRARIAHLLGEIRAVAELPLGVSTFGWLGDQELRFRVPSAVVYYTVREGEILVHRIEKEEEHVARAG